MTSKKTKQNNNSQQDDSADTSAILLLEKQKQYYEFMIKLMQKRAFQRSLNEGNFIGTEIYRTYKRYFNALFTWTNLPKGLTSKWINKILIEYGHGVFFKIVDKVYFLPYNVMSRDLQNGEPHEIRPIQPFTGNNGNLFDNSQSKILNAKLNFNKQNIELSNCVPIYFNSNEYTLKELFGSIIPRLNDIFTAMRTDLYGATTGMLIFLENGQEQSTQLSLTELSSNFEYFKTISGVPRASKNKDPIFNKSNIINGDRKSNQADLWHSFDKTLNLIDKISGIASNDNNKTSGTQETDAQATASKTTQSVLISDMIKGMRLNLSHVNTIFKTKIEVSLNLDVLNEVKELFNLYHEKKGVDTIEQ